MQCVLLQVKKKKDAHYNFAFVIRVQLDWGDLRAQVDKEEYLWVNL